MASGEPGPTTLTTPVEATWRGWLAFVLLAAVGAFGPDITPSRYYPDLSHYIPRYALLALSIGAGIHAIRSGRRGDRLIGLAVLLVGGWMVWHVVSDCLPVLGR